MPDYIPEHDAKILARVRSRAYRLDVCLFNFLGIRFGWSSVIGIIPVIGDVLDFLFALSVVRTCAKIKCGLTKADYSLMMMHLAIDFAVGLVPFLGDLVDAAYKANTKNLRVLERRLDAVYKPKPQQERDETLPPGRRPRPATVYEDFTETDLEGLRNPPPYSTEQNMPAEPQPSFQPERKSGWRTWLGKSEQPVDVEKGPSRRGDANTPTRDSHSRRTQRSTTSHGGAPQSSRANAPSPMNVRSAPTDSGRDREKQGSTSGPRQGRRQGSSRR